MVCLKKIPSISSITSSNFEFDNQFFGHIPNRLTMCTVGNRSMYGVFKENPFHFKHNNLETLTVSVESDTLIRLDFDFDNGNYVEAYDTLLCVLQDNIKVVALCW